MPTTAEMARDYITPTSLPMREAVALWEQKTPLSQAEIEARAKVNHDTAFTVGGITDADMLQRVYDEIGRAIGEGMHFRDFKKHLVDVWEHAGYTGGKAYRIGTVYRTNLQSAYNAGRYQQMKRVARRRPFWEYLTVEDSRRRPSHAAMHGKVFRADDAIWNTWYPPNGFGCRCKARSLSERQLKKLGIKVLSGKTVIQPPDRGFTRLPYASVLAAITPAETAVKGKTVLPKDPNFVPAAEIPARHVLPIGADDILPAGKSEAFYLKAFFSEFGFDPDDGGFFELPQIGRTIRIGRELFLQKNTGKLKITKRGRERYLKLLAATIKNPYEIWSDTETMPDGSRRAVLKLVRLFRDEKGKVGGFSVFSLDSTRGWTGVSTYVPSAGANEAQILRAVDRRRTGVLEYREGADNK